MKSYSTNVVKMYTLNGNIKVYYYYYNIKYYVGSNKRIYDFYKT